ncbi:MAG: flagellar export protein FliJ [Burkholderiales bacterium]
MASFGLAPLLGVAKMRLDEAERRLGLLSARRTEAQGKLALLGQYSSEYSGQLDSAQRAGMEVYRWQDYLAFTAKLERAKVQQREEVARCAQAWEAGFKEWQALKSRHEALLALETRHRLAEQIKERRADQKLQDEFAARSGTNLPVAE